MLFSLSQSLPLTKIGQIDGRFLCQWGSFFLKAQKFGGKKVKVCGNNLSPRYKAETPHFNVETVIFKRNEKKNYGQFHQRFLHAFFVRIFCQSQNVTRKKLLKLRSYEKFVRKNVDEIDTWREGLVVCPLLHGNKVLGY